MEHDELLKDARGVAERMANMLSGPTLQGIMAFARRDYREAVATLRALADVVEQEDKRVAAATSNHSVLLNSARSLADTIRRGLSRGTAPTRQECELMELAFRTFADILAAQDKSTAELVAACKACDEVIGAFIREYPAREALDNWAKLRAARKLAHVAVANHEKASVQDDVDATLDAATTDYDELLKRLADTPSGPVTVGLAFRDADGTIHLASRQTDTNQAEGGE